jgi:3-(methylsulfanyl)propanoyl-CoA dehydrogenase
VELLSDATRSLLKALASGPERALAVAVPYLKLCGFVAGGWLMARSASLAAAKLSGSDRDFYAAKLHSARFYAEQVLPTALAHARIVTSGATSVTESDAALI